MGKRQNCQKTRDFWLRSMTWGARNNDRITGYEDTTERKYLKNVLKYYTMTHDNSWSYQKLCRIVDNLRFISGCDIANESQLTLSMRSGRLVAASTVMSFSSTTPSISVKSWAITRSTTSPAPPPCLHSDSTFKSIQSLSTIYILHVIFNSLPARFNKGR